MCSFFLTASFVLFVHIFSTGCVVLLYFYIAFLCQFDLISIFIRRTIVSSFVSHFVWFLICEHYQQVLLLYTIVEQLNDDNDNSDDDGNVCVLDRCQAYRPRWHGQIM